MYPKQRLLHHNYLLSFATSKLTSDFFICPKPCRGFAEDAGQSIIHDRDCGESSPWRKLGKKKQFLQQQDTPQPSSAGNVSTHGRASKQRDGEEARVNIVLFRINEKAQGLGQWEARSSSLLLRTLSCSCGTRLPFATTVGAGRPDIDRRSVESMRREKHATKKHATRDASNHDTHWHGPRLSIHFLLDLLGALFLTLTALHTVGPSWWRVRFVRGHP